MSNVNSEETRLPEANKSVRKKKKRITTSVDRGIEPIKKGMGDEEEGPGRFKRSYPTSKVLTENRTTKVSSGETSGRVGGDGFWSRSVIRDVVDVDPA